jgi:hypothetical protein
MIKLQLKGDGINKEIRQYKGTNNEKILIFNITFPDNFIIG